MRGFPLLQMLIVAVVFAAAIIPVWSLTRSPTQRASVVVTMPAAATPTSATSLQPITVSAAFAPAPADFQVQCDGQTVLAGHAPASQFSALYQAPLPAEGVDFVVRAKWPNPGEAAPAGPAATRLILRLPNGTQVDKTFWTAPGESLAEIITVPGSAVLAR